MNPAVRHFSALAGLLLTAALRAQEVDLLRAGNDALAAGQLDAAAQAFVQAAKTPELAGIAFFNLGLVYARQNSLDRSENAFSMAGAHLYDPADRARAHYSRGTVLATAGRLREASFEYQAALRLAPGMEDARINLAIVHAKLRRSPPPQPPHHEPDPRTRRPAYSFPAWPSRDRQATSGKDWSP